MEEPCTIECLPDGLLGHIMALAGREHGRSLMLVSHRWHRLFLSEPTLWHDLGAVGCCSETVAAQQRRLKGQAVRLRRVAPLVRRFTWQHHIDEDDLEVQGAQAAAEVGLSRCLSALQPGRLAELRLLGDVSLQGGAGAALQQLTSIRSLLLQYCTDQGTATAVAAVGSNLRSLHLLTGTLSAAAVDSIGQLAQLTELGIRARDWPELSCLTRLGRLKQLVLLSAGDSSERPMQPPPPANFSAGLERFCFESRHHPFQMGLCELKSCMLWQGGIDAVRTSAMYPAIELPLPTLALHCSTPIPSLPRLLSALQPRNMPPPAFERLELEGHLPRPSDSAACTQLRQLSELAVKAMQPAAGGALELGLAGLLQQSSRLSSLHISNTGWGLPGQSAALGAVPACLASYRGLASLALHGQELADLPPGEYLAGLRHLDLPGNSLPRVPAAISAATGLTSLNLNWNQNLSLCEAGMATLLTLHHLQRLQLMLVKSADSELLRRLPPSISCDCFACSRYQ